MSKRRASLRQPASLENPPTDVRPAAGAGGESVAAQEARDVESRIHEILGSEIGKDGYVRLYRRKPMEAEFKQLTGRLALDQFSCDWVLETYGGGEYQVRAYGSGHRMIKQLTWSVDPAIPTKTPGSAPAPAAGDSGAEGIIRALHEASPKESGSSGDKILALMMAQNTALIQALARGGSGGGSDGKLLEVLLPRLLEERRQTPMDEMMKFSSFIEKVKKGEATGGEEDDRSPLEKIAEKVMEMLGPVLAAKFGAVPGGSGAAIPALADGPAIPAGSGQPGPTPAKIRVVTPQRPAAPQAPAEQNMQVILDRFRSAALKAAADKKDPFQWTDSMLEFVPSNLHGEIYGFVNSDDWFAKLFPQGSADATKHFDFLRDVRTQILTIAFANSAIFAKTKRNPSAAPDAFAKEFLAWACPSLKEEFAEYVRDPEFFPEIFGDGYELNKEWLDKLNAAMQSETAPPAEASPADGAN